MNEEELHHRIESAIILLEDGHPFKVGDLTFGCINENNFSVTGWTLCNDLKNLTKHKALIELNETKILFNQMKSVSPALTNFIKDRQIQYSLGFDYGMGAIEICSETNGNIKWTTELEQ
jgi:hypothetical protein